MTHVFFSVPDAEIHDTTFKTRYRRCELNPGKLTDGTVKASHDSLRGEACVDYCYAKVISEAYAADAASPSLPTVYNYFVSTVTDSSTTDSSTCKCLQVPYSPVLWCMHLYT